MTFESPRQREALVLPAFNPTDRLLDRSTESGETNRGPIHAVAMRSGAVDHEVDAGLITGEIPLGIRPCGRLTAPGMCPGFEHWGTAHIEQHKALHLTGAGLIHIPTISLKRQKGRKMSESILASSRGTAVTGLESMSRIRSC